MTEHFSARRSDSRVAIATLPEARYSRAVEGKISQKLQQVAKDLEWVNPEGGTFGEIIPAGARVLVKPNLVLHENQGPWGFDAVVTHPSLIQTVVESVLLANPAQVLVGDAPLQGCDFDKLLSKTGLGDWSQNLMARESRFKGVRDFRRTTCTFENGVRHATENLRPKDDFVLFDLGTESLLEPVTDGRDNFRVTCYDWRLLAKTHTTGRHCYLIARDVIEADVVINLPKLKTHKKAGITCALKNLVGINGNKENLPHHRLGGSKVGGDCYPGGSLVKQALEYTLDRQNTSEALTSVRMWNSVALQLHRAMRLAGDQVGVEGSWSGNDTVWRMSLDLNRILLYGRPDGTLADVPQRRVIHVVDAVVAGQGDGPLSPQPLPLGMILAGANAAAVDWVGARLLGYDPTKVPIVREAFGSFRHPLISFAPSEVRVVGDTGTGMADDVLAGHDVVNQVIHPVGWRDAAAVSPSPEAFL
jgi:uncharacterized protein (DUF362 family)